MENDEGLTNKNDSQLDDEELDDNANNYVPEPSQTQADVTGMITAIFGDDDSGDDDDDDIKVTNKYKFLNDDNDDGNLMDDESDDEGTLKRRAESSMTSGVASSKRKRLSKALSSKRKGGSEDASSSSSLNNASDGDGGVNKDKGKASKLKLSKLSKKKDKDKSSSSSRGKITKKSISHNDDKDESSSSRHRKGGSVKTTTDKPSSTGVDSGDEYDSEEDVVRTAVDDRFIDQTDDFADLVREYEEDGEQRFDDERPEGYRGAMKKGKKFGGGTGGSSSSQVQKDLDPMSQTLLSMKKVKEAVMAENDKAKIATDLMTKMDLACRQDEECVRRGEPAVHKLQLLPVVQKIVGMKHMQLTLLEYDLLNVLKDWIEPRDSKSLPSHAVRTAVYDMLLKLPCQVEHLKRAAPGKQPIGATIVTLRKHTAETVDNKRLLRELMEKWCRPVFDKSLDPRRMAVGREQSNELRELAARREREREILLAQPAAGGSISPRSLSSAAAGSAVMSGSGSRFDDILGGGDKQSQSQQQQQQQIPAKDKFNRVRTPYSSGFLFTVQPSTVMGGGSGIDQKQSTQQQHGSGHDSDDNNESSAATTGGQRSGVMTVARRSRQESMGEGRLRLLKLMKDSSGGGGGAKRGSAGKVVNPRAVSMALTGRNKS